MEGSKFIHISSEIGIKNNRGNKQEIPGKIVKDFYDLLIYITLTVLVITYLM